MTKKWEKVIKKIRNNSGQDVEFELNVCFTKWASSLLSNCNASDAG
jgi:hypothetical protein